MTSVTLSVHISLAALAMFVLKAWRSTAFALYGYLNFTKAGFLEHSKRFKPEDMEAKIPGKNCIITGANSGIGYATAEGLAQRGATVYLVCRNKERGEAALSKIQSTTGNQNVHLEVCDLSSVSEIKSLASRFSKKDVPVHMLKAAPDARVITVSSGGMYASPLTTDLMYSESNFKGVEQYSRNKRVQVALTEKWAEKYMNKGIGFYSMHPGWAETPGVARSLPSFNEKLKGKLRTSEEGADTVIWLALQAKDKLVPGAFYFDRAEAPKHLKFAAATGSHALIDSIISSLNSMASLSA
ncbi:uncharacterized protein LOC129292770 isoform X2 [Prosopis cineraria]|uniref:uncharacterized protein LOC129292770 isoform X2 n=1 Tax=Prosopis cineraria TaxID=364024 RepID=UPI00240ED5FF|nr:uncharacterized protein LOC129292770 isoform X2 [Prosopis cineraria]